MNAARVLGYAVSGVSVLFGAAILAGFFLADPLPQQVRITFGVVLVLMGIYRFVVTKVQAMRKDERGNE